MKTVLLVAFGEEIQPIVKIFRLKGPQQYEYTKQWTGDAFTLIETGIGKVNAAAVTQLVIFKENPDFVVNAGFSGGFRKNITIGDIILVSEVIQYDIDQTVAGFKLGEIPGSGHVRLKLTVPKELIEKYKTGTCLTGDRVLADKKYGSWLSKKFHPSVIDMELGAIAQVCQLYKIKLISIKCPIDIVENEDISSWRDNMDEYSLRVCGAIKNIINVLTA